MSEILMKKMQCPTCGASLKVKAAGETITCVYCGNTIVPVAVDNAAGKETNGTVKVEGIETASSALAYMELFFEEYDWETFAYTQSLCLEELDQLVSGLKVTSADDKNTWFAAFRAAYIPLSKKVAGCKKILADLIAEYEKDNLEVYSKFDAYKRVTGLIADQKTAILGKLRKAVDYAEKYGASVREAEDLRSQLEQLENALQLPVYEAVEQIPEVAESIRRVDAQIAQDLAKAGIDAQAVYAEAKAMMEKQLYVGALNKLRQLNGYLDSYSLIERIDRYFLIGDAVEICGRLYCFTGKDSGLSLYPTAGDVPAETPLVTDIGKVVTNYADILYYLDTNQHLTRVSLNCGEKTQLCDETLNKEEFYASGRKVAFLTDSYSEKKVMVLDTETGNVHVLMTQVQEVAFRMGSKLVCVCRENHTNEESTKCTRVLDIETGHILTLAQENISVEGYMGDYLVYTQQTPNKFNLNLYIKSMTREEPEKLVEANIYQFCTIREGKLFYYVGSSRQKSLIQTNVDGTERIQWPRDLHKIVLAQGDWLYYIRKAGYDALLCKSRLDGSDYSVIADDVDSFVELKNGYLYYLNDWSSLVKIRMDGANKQVLCHQVKQVLAVKEDRILFLSRDDDAAMAENEEEEVAAKAVVSLYGVDFSGGKIKLAYNVQKAAAYDENTVWFVGQKQVLQPYDKLQQDEKLMLYKLQVDTYQTEALLNMETTPEQEGLSTFAKLIIAALTAFVFALIFMGEVMEFGIFLIILSLIFFGCAVGSSVKKQLQ